MPDTDPRQPLSDHLPARAGVSGAWQPRRGNQMADGLHEEDIGKLTKHFGRTSIEASPCRARASRHPSSARASTYLTNQARWQPDLKLDEAKPQIRNFEISDWTGPICNFGFRVCDFASSNFDIFYLSPSVVSVSLNVRYNCSNSASPFFRIAARLGRSAGFKVKCTLWAK